jgi:uncharacterized protein YheU (UPF0270 family)
MLIPFDQLSQDALQGVMDSYINREGTDYGDVEMDLASKRNQLLALLKKGEVVIVFDAASETINLLSKRDYALLQQQADQSSPDY